MQTLNSENPATKGQKSAQFVTPLHLLLPPKRTTNPTSSLQNLEHARSLLLQLEHTASTQKIASRKTALQSDLQSKRALIKHLNQRLYELNQLDDSNASDSDAGSAASDSEDSDLFPSYAPANKAADAGIERRQTAGDEAMREAAEGLTSTLRARKGAGAGTSSRQAKNTDTDTGTGTGSDLFTARQNPSADPHLAQTETLLEHNRTEQESLTSSLLAMAQQLKTQSVRFGSTLEADKGVLDRAVTGLDKGALGMEAAGQRMGTLRRMTEGKGWWGRIKLYAIIFMLWVAAFLIVFAMPKLRF